MAITAQQSSLATVPQMAEMIRTSSHSTTSYLPTFATFLRTHKGKDESYKFHLENLPNRNEEYLVFFTQNQISKSEY